MPIRNKNAHDFIYKSYNFSLFVKYWLEKYAMPRFMRLTKAQ